MRLFSFLVLLTVLLPCYGQFFHNFLLGAIINNGCKSKASGSFCQNNGTCIIDDHGPTCQCVNGWNGKFCEKCHGLANNGICHTCAGVSCLNGGICVVSVDGISCACKWGFYGEICEFSETEKMGEPSVQTTMLSAKETTLLLDTPFLRPVDDVVIDESNLTFTGLSSSTYLEKLRFYTNVSVEVTFDSHNISELSTLDERQIESNIITAPDTIITANITVKFSDHVSGNNISTLNDITDFLNSKEESDANDVASIAATVVQKPDLPIGSESWLPAAFIMLIIVGIAGVAKYRRVVVRGFYTPTGLPQHFFKNVLPHRLPVTKFTPLHDALKLSTESIGAIDGDWIPLLSSIDPIGQTPLHATVGARADKPESHILVDLESILTPETNIDQRDFARNTPLHLAVKCCRPHVVANLLQRGADPNAYGPQGMTALAMAIFTKSLECFQMLLNHENIDPNIAIEPEDTPLKMCIMRGTAFNKFVDALLRHSGTDIMAIGNLRNGPRRSPIHVAVTSKNVYALKRLIEKHANLTTKDRDGKTPLLLAIEIEALEIARLLIFAMKASNFYNSDHLLSPIEQAKHRKLYKVLDWMKQVEVNEAKPGKRRHKLTRGGSIVAKKPRKDSCAFDDPELTSQCTSKKNANKTNVQQKFLDGQLLVPTITTVPDVYENYDQSLVQEEHQQAVPISMNHTFSDESSIFPFQPLYQQSVYNFGIPQTFIETTSATAQPTYECGYQLAPSTTSFPPPSTGPHDSQQALTNPYPTMLTNYQPKYGQEFINPVSSMETFVSQCLQHTCSNCINSDTFIM